jgi:predicted metal-dependent HD superfamily phosphohydrolase
MLNTNNDIQTENISLLPIAETHVFEFFRNSISEKYVYHDIGHTVDVVTACRELGAAYKISPADYEILILAAWFHDTGFEQGPYKHEERSAQNAQNFLSNFNYPDIYAEKIRACILATKIPQEPHTLLEKIICDADLSHLGTKKFWLRAARVREEMALADNRLMSEEQWIDFEITFLLGHQFHTDIAQRLFDKRKAKHLKQMQQQKKRLAANDVANNFEDLITLNASLDEKTAHRKEEKKTESRSFGRGVETMYRTAYDTHNNLSAIADQKSNLMLSINTIMITIILTVLIPQLDASPHFVVPTFALLAVCLCSIVLATLSTRPKVTTGQVTLDDIRNKRSNLLFFGNFYKMKLDDYQWGVMEMVKDPDFQYSSMTRDLYFLGKVLARKYKYLTICYNIFMFGITFSVFLFAIAFVVGGSFAGKSFLFFKVK